MTDQTAAPDTIAPRTGTVPDAWEVNLGGLRLRYLPDVAMLVYPDHWYPTSTDEQWRAASRHLTAGGHLPIGAGALLIERDGHRLVIDAGMGDIPGTPESRLPFMHEYLHVGQLPARLRAADVEPASIEAVLITHGHSDHVGWAAAGAAGNDESLFPAAQWVTGEADQDLYNPLASDDRRIRKVVDGEEVLPGVRAWALPGHTPGHTAYVFDTGDGRELVTFGDAMHTAAQVRHPEWLMTLDADPTDAERSRRALIQRLSGPRTIGFANHFGDEQLGRVVDGDWVAIER